MAEPIEQETQTTAGDRRDNERRAGDRRRTDRRFPVPVWRRPLAFVAYGVAAAALVVVLSEALSDPEPESEREAGLDITTVVAPPAAGPAGAAARAPVRDAYSVGEFERLVAEGAAAEGQRVRAVLFCEPTGQVALRDVDQVHPAVADLADATRRVPGADCKWGGDPNAPDFLLLVPPGLAERFAAAPEVRQGFVTRRRVSADVRWLGRSDALALRTAGVLEGIGAAR